MNFTNISRGVSFAVCCLFIVLSASSARAGVNVTVTWNRNREPDIAGYRVHFGSISDPYAKRLNVKTNTASLANLVAGTTYIIAVSAYNTAGAESALSDPVAYLATTRPFGGQKITLDNTSSRVSVQPGDNAMIGGFIVRGSAPKTLVLRAIGPSLANAGVAGALDDPVLEVRDSAGTLIASNDNWNQADAEALVALGLAPSNGREAALVLTLPAGAYSGIVRGKGSSRGVALFELYNLDRTQGSVANTSTRGRVETGDQVMIDGFIVKGTTPTKVIVRALGPSLAVEGIQDPLLDPAIELYDSDGSLIASNADWRSDQAAAIIDSTIAPRDDREAAIVRTLSPGTYSAIVRGQGETSGVGLFEVYALEQ